MKRFLTLLALLLALPLAANAWWDKEWSGRKKLTLDTKAAPLTSDVESLPVLVRLSSGNFDFLAGKEDGSDLRFLAEDDKTPLPFHIERYDQINELAFVWVRVPRLAAGNSSQHIWLYYGNLKAEAPDEAGPRYDDAQLAVYHLGEEQGPAQDASGQGRHLAQAVGTPVSAGLIGGALRLEGQGGLLVEDAALQAAAELTVSFWLRAEQADGELLAQEGWSLHLVGGIPELRHQGRMVRAASALPAGWQHLAVTAGKQFVLHVNGAVAGTLAGTLSPSPRLRVGTGLKGQLDELQISGVARPAIWLLAQVQSQGEGGKLLRQGEEQTTDTSGEPNYFAATMKNLTVDGWVVVIICVGMFVVAIWIMYDKTLTINRMERTNARFSEEFEELSRTLRQAERSAQTHVAHFEQLSGKVTEYTNSSLHRIYKVGVAELKSRFPLDGEHGKAPPVVSSQALDAVRATLDAQLTRERHGLEKGMVLLTIAISGGPFLGLLGTVVGVMITFAAIAAAGDVNVNAIAPGIAAALVATVAGLGVAIPSLFGYNYLMTKIKGLSADMHVFVDEFVTKMAENYGS